jgi:genome maintenance exonuclease 1
MKKFNHVQHGIVLPDPHCETTPNGRFYYPPNGEKYPSVTTVLSIQDKSGLEAWKKRVGEEEAKKISNQAAVRGTEVHLIAEEYIDNKADYARGKMPANLFTFNSIKPLLDANLDNIWYQEAPLYSQFIRTAGRVDLIAEWQGKLSIIDFKTSRKPKKKEWIKGYFMQESFYAVAFEERTGKPIKQLVTLVAVDDDEPQVFIEDRDNHIHDFIKLREQFKKERGI